MCLGRDDDPGITRAQGRADKATNGVQEESVRLIELDEVLGLTQLRPVGLRRVIAGAAVLGNRSGICSSNRTHPRARRATTGRELFQILAFDAHGAVSKPVDRELAGTDAAPDGGPAHPKQRRRLGDVVIGPFVYTFRRPGGSHGRRRVEHKVHLFHLVDVIAMNCKTGWPRAKQATDELQKGSMRRLKYQIDLPLSRSKA